LVLPFIKDGVSSYWLNGLRKGDEYAVYIPLRCITLFTFYRSLLPVVAKMTTRLTNVVEVLRPIASRFDNTLAIIRPLRSGAAADTVADDDDDDDVDGAEGANWPRQAQSVSPDGDDRSRHPPFGLRTHLCRLGCRRIDTGDEGDSR